MAAAHKREIEYLPAAQDDLAQIYGWIHKDSPSRADAFVEGLERRIGALARHPELGRVPKHPKLADAGYRVLTIDSYLIFYVPRERVVEIHRAIHGSRSLDEIV